MPVPVSPCLQLDMGNSSAKWRLVVDDEVRARGCYRPDEAASREDLLALTPAPQRIWVASVASAEAEAALADLMLQHWQLQPWFARSAARTGDLISSYREPGRLGVDRWLAMLAARARHPGRCCVIDAGSALTIDIVAADGRHEGGYIIPGAQLMERSLLLDTQRVRFDEPIAYALEPGRSTAEAVRHGIAVAQVGAVTAALDALGGEAPALVCCGGGGRVLLELLGREIDWAPDLVLDGLALMAAEAGR